MTFFSSEQRSPGFSIGCLLLGFWGPYQERRLIPSRGLEGGLFWKKDILAAIGFSRWESFLSRSPARSGERWKKILDGIVCLAHRYCWIPLVVILSGFNNFLIIIGLAGGVFISVQYLFIIAVGRRTLQLSAREKALLDILVLFLFAPRFTKSLCL